MKEEPFYVYHYSTVGSFKEIKPRVFQNKNTDPSDSYNWHVSWFGASIAEGIQLLKDNGFVRWNHEVVYEYVINLNKNKSAFYYKLGGIIIYSSPEETEYHDTHWDREYEAYKKRHPEEDKESYVKFLKEYKDRMRRALKPLGLTVPLSLKEYMNHKLMKEYNKNILFYIEKMVKSPTANKDQYASEIPHVMAYVKNSLKIEKVNKIILK